MLVVRVVVEFLLSFNIKNKTLDTWLENDYYSFLPLFNLGFFYIVVRCTLKHLEFLKPNRQQGFVKKTVHYEDNPIPYTYGDIWRMIYCLASHSPTWQINYRYTCARGTMAANSIQTDNKHFIWLPTKVCNTLFRYFNYWKYTNTGKVSILLPFVKICSMLNILNNWIIFSIEFCSCYNGPFQSLFFELKSGIQKRKCSSDSFTEMQFNPKTMF